MALIDEFKISIKSIFDGSGVDAAQKSLTTLLTTATASALALGKLIDGFGDKYKDIYFQSQLYQSSIVDLQKYIVAGEQTLYSSGAGVREEIERLMVTIRRAKQEGGVPMIFQRLGIDLNTKPEDILEQMRRTFHAMGNEQAFALAESGGLQNLYHILKLTKKEMLELANIPMLSKAQIEDGLALSQTMKNLLGYFKQLKDVAIAELAPALNNELLKFFNWIKTNERSVIGFFGNVLTLMKDFITATGRTVLIIKDVAEALLGSRGLEIAFFSLLAVLKPSYAMLTGLVLILEDLYIYMQGGDSLLGAFVNKIGKLGTVIGFGALGGLLAFLTTFNTKLLTSIGLLKAATGLTTKLGGLGLAMSVYNVAQENKEINATGNQSAGGVGNILTKAGEFALSGGMMGGIGGVPGALIGAGIGGLAGIGIGAYQNYIAGDRQKELSSNNTSNQTFNITVDATKKEGAREIAEEVQRIFSLNMQNSMVGY